MTDKEKLQLLLAAIHHMVERDFVTSGGLLVLVPVLREINSGAKT